MVLATIQHKAAISQTAFLAIIVAKTGTFQELAFLAYKDLGEVKVLAHQGAKALRSAKKAKEEARRKEKRAPLRASHSRLRQ